MTKATTKINSKNVPRGTTHIEILLRNVSGHQSSVANADLHGVNTWVVYSKGKKHDPQGYLSTTQTYKWLNDIVTNIGDRENKDVYALFDHTTATQHKQKFLKLKRGERYYD